MATQIPRVLPSSAGSASRVVRGAPAGSVPSWASCTHFLFAGAALGRGLGAQGDPRARECPRVWRGPWAEAQWRSLQCFFPESPQIAGSCELGLWLCPVLCPRGLCCMTRARELTKGQWRLVGTRSEDSVVCTQGKGQEPGGGKGSCGREQQ